MSTLLSKRTLLQTLAGLAIASAAGLAQARTPAIAAIDAEGAADIGRSWLAQHPETASALRADLVPPSDDAPLRLRSRVRDDFRAGRMFIHRGWYLSETEARLCALITIS
ncbi:hypothetical protein Q0812_07985 [Brevundimonas sp. 2R-24]|uniref:Uncharacterized protein n=1 Tax=Peiella sedimenti TaxID=3061083 RepID=A0ABT8SLY4_9CAUL|nr:hypothetical protein [Caulobacteraceae bacterium XZ-24]